MKRLLCRVRHLFLRLKYSPYHGQPSQRNIFSSGEKGGYDIYGTRRGWAIKYWTVDQDTKGIFWSWMFFPYDNLFPMDVDWLALWNERLEKVEPFIPGHFQKVDSFVERTINTLARPSRETRKLGIRVLGQGSVRAREVQYGDSR